MLENDWSFTEKVKHFSEVLDLRVSELWLPRFLFI
jgi:hypothetical protein